MAQDDGKCHYTFLWHEGRPEQRRYARTAPQHDLVEVADWFGGVGPDGHTVRITVCRRCDKEIA